MPSVRLMQRTAVLLVGALLLTSQSTAFAHAGQVVTPADVWHAWNAEFWMLLTLEVSGFGYVYGVWRAWNRSGRGHAIPVRSVLCFVGAYLALGVALISPLDALSETLFSAHMTQHLILMLIAAPLLVLSDFPLALMWALPRRTASAIGRGWHRASLLRRGWRLLDRPLTAWFLFGLAMWAWHVPMLYQLALYDDTVHAVEHLSFVVTAMLFWQAVFACSRPSSPRYGIAVPYLFSTAIHSSILGALFTFAAQPWYPYYAAPAAPWGLTALQDQQLAGLIMWIPAGTLFTLLSLVYFKAWLSGLDRRFAQTEHR